MFRTCGCTQEQIKFQNVKCLRAPPYIEKNASTNNKNREHPYPISPFDDKHAMENPL